MFAFIIALHIVLPNHEERSFRIYSHERYGEGFCMERARHAAERYMDYANQHIPKFATITAEVVCEQSDTRFI